MDINDAVRRQREWDAKQQEAGREREAAAEYERIEKEKLAKKFAQWAIKSGIEPVVLQVKYVKRPFRKGETVPTLLGWVLHTEPRDGGWGGNQGFSISTTGTIHNQIDNFFVDSESLQSYIVAFIVRSRSHVPWPD
jgi:hypothetical protein